MFQRFTVSQLIIAENFITELENKVFGYNKRKKGKVDVSAVYKKERRPETPKSDYD